MSRVPTWAPSTCPNYPPQAPGHVSQVPTIGTRACQSPLTGTPARVKSPHHRHPQHVSRLPSQAPQHVCPRVPPQAPSTCPRVPYKHPITSRAPLQASPARVQKVPTTGTTARVKSTPPQAPGHVQEYPPPGFSTRPKVHHRHQGTCPEYPQTPEHMSRVPTSAGHVSRITLQAPQHVSELPTTGTRARVQVPPQAQRHMSVPHHRHPSVQSPPTGTPARGPDYPTGTQHVSRYPTTGTPARVKNPYRHPSTCPRVPPQATQHVSKSAYRHPQHVSGYPPGHPQHVSKSAPPQAPPARVQVPTTGTRALCQSATTGTQGHMSKIATTGT
ncbi:extensin-like [Homarus americanus]|uniref:extensin-like n=1 Tax=Homarus americanus TaxID=6706 RepID=UPI001C48D1C1|nr:extensin-like [Homarus americanus]XP_042205609.1 extensin-like [Homarus americanus]